MSDDTLTLPRWRRCQRVWSCQMWQLPIHICIMVLIVLSSPHWRFLFTSWEVIIALSGVFEYLFLQKKINKIFYKVIRTMLRYFVHATTTKKLIHSNKLTFNTDAVLFLICCMQQKRTMNRPGFWHKVHNLCIRYSTCIFSQGKKYLMLSIIGLLSRGSLLH